MPRTPASPQEPPWPGEDGWNEHGNEGKQEPENGGSSGPLGSPEQVTGGLERRLIRRYSEPLSSQPGYQPGQQPPKPEDTQDVHKTQPTGQTGDTDEVVQLPPGYARLLRHALNPKPDRLHEIADMPTAPLPPRPSQPGPFPMLARGPLSRRLASVGIHSHSPHSPRAYPLSVPMPESSPEPPPVLSRILPPLSPMAAPRVTTPAPLDMARLAMRTWHLATQDGVLPANVLMMLDGHTRRLWLAPLLVMAALAGGTDWQSWRGHPDRLANAIEARPIVRYLLAALYAVTHAEMPRTGTGANTPQPPYRALTVMLAPVDGRMRHVWLPWHGAWYTRVMRLSNILLAPHTALDSLTAGYLGLQPGELVPPLHRGERRRAVMEHALLCLPALRVGCQTPQQMDARAWAHYTRHLARVAAVPECVIAERLAGDRRTIRTPEDLCRWTDDVLASEPELGMLRCEVAASYHLYARDATRAAPFLTAPQRVALWIAEPS